MWASQSEPSRASQAQPASEQVQVQTSSDCLRCGFGCNNEDELDNHMEQDHHVPKPIQRALHPGGIPCQDCQSKERLMMEHISKIERLELMTTGLETDLKEVNTKENKLSEEKDRLGKYYKEASRVIGELQRKLTNTTEKSNVMANLANITEQAKQLDTLKDKPEEWEEVWEVNDDESGNLVSQTRTEVEKYQWKSNLACKKCDKVLQSDQQFRQHLKEHKRLNEELIKCHHCDFITNDEDAHVNHIVDIHSTNHTCNSCKAVFSSKKYMIEHARKEHGFNYIKSGQPKKDIECHDCEESFSSRFQLMEHKKGKHYKKKLFSYYHGTGWGCRLENRCMNIHGESIKPELASDNRSRIPCKHGDQCHYYQNDSCHYKHTSSMYAPSAPPYDPEGEVQFVERITCSQCNYETNTNIELGYHIETIHGACTRNNGGIVTNTFPVGHTQWAINQNMKQDEHLCNECKLVFTNKTILHAHMSNKRNANHNNNCSKCSKLFDTKEGLNEHMNQNHGGCFSIEAALLKITEKIDTFSERLQSLEQKSLTIFPNLGPHLKEK